MARVSQEFQQFNFSQGKITEATPLTFPENAALELDNMDLRKDGSVRRRLGVDYEVNYNPFYTFNKTDFETQGVNNFLWKSVGGVGGRDFAVVQIGFKLYFFDATADSFSDNYITVAPLDLSSYALPGAIGDKEFSFSAGNGYLFVVGEEIEPLYVEYDNTGPSFSTRQINIKIRDFDGVDDALDIDERPTFLLPAHRYNLRNQGWPNTFSCFQLENGDSAPLITDPIQHTYNKVGFYPSNADIIHLGKSTASKFIEGIGSYSPWFLQKLNVGNTRAPRGRYILDAFVRDRASVSGISIPTVTYNSRPSATAFFAGRVFYAGMTDGDLVGTIYFSQLLTDIDRAGNCYQEQDPTAEQLNSLLATDGGAIEIPDVGRIYKLIPFERSIVIVADNGVWEIVSSDTTGFTASSFFIRFVTTTGAISPGTVTAIEGGVCYWADSGIYLLSPDPTSGILSATNLTLNTIQQDYLAIPESSRLYARSFYDAETNKLIFLYKENQSLTQSNYQFDKILYLDITLSAFYTYTLSFDGADAPIVCGITRKRGLGVADETFDIVLSPDDVVLSPDDVVHTQANAVTSTTSAIKLITAANATSTERALVFSEFYDRGFVDWESSYGAGNGLDFTSKMVTGYQIMGEAARNKQIQWYIPHFERTERNFVNVSGDIVYDFPSACTMQVRYDFTSTSTAGKWAGTFEGYRLKVPYLHNGVGVFDYSYEVISTKNRVRGAGRALQFSITSQPGKDIRLLGWDVVITGRSRV